MKNNKQDKNGKCLDKTKLVNYKASFSLTKDEYIRGYCEAIGSSHNEEIAKDADLITNSIMSKLEAYEERGLVKTRMFYDAKNDEIKQEITVIPTIKTQAEMMILYCQNNPLMDCSNYFCPKEVFEYIRIEGLFDLNDFRTDKNTNPKIVKALKEEIKILNREKSAKKNNYPNANNDHNYQKRKGVKRWNRSNYKNL